MTEVETHGGWTIQNKIERIPTKNIPTTCEVCKSKFNFSKSKNIKTHDINVFVDMNITSKFLGLKKFEHIKYEPATAINSVCPFCGYEEYFAAVSKNIGHKSFTRRYYEE